MLKLGQKSYYMNKNVYTILLIVFVLFFGCSSDDTSSLEIIEEEDQTEEVKTFSFLALGDSYTFGEGVTEDQTWPFELKDAFATPSKKIDDVKIFATTGWTTTNLIAAMEESSLQSRDLVSLMIGVNNQFQRVDFTTFELEFNELLSKAISLANNDKDRVIVISIPDYGVTPFGSNNSEIIASEIDNYNAYIKQKCIEQQIAFIDVTPISRELGDSEGALVADDLHPSPFQYSLWVEKIVPVVKKILE